MSAQLLCVEEMKNLYWNMNESTDNKDNNARIDGATMQT